MTSGNRRPLASPRVLSRRELLSYAWLAALAAAIATGLRAGLHFARPRPGEFGGVLDMGPASELPPPGSSPVNQPEGRFWLVATDEGILAINKACTHLDCLCDWDEQNREFVCPCHGSRFAEDGTYISGPATRSLDRYVIQIVSPTGETIAETDPVLGTPVLLPGQGDPGWSPEGASPAESAEEETVEQEPGVEDAGYIILVDTGRKILGAGPAGLDQ